MGREQEIAAGQNLFDTKSTRSKFPVGGQSRPSTSTSSQPRHKPSASSLRVTGRPSQSRSRADQIRREELLPEYLSRHRNSSFLDRRFASGPADDAALERFTRERQERFERDRRGVEEPAGGLGGRKGKRKVFNLEDDDEGLFDDEGLGGGGLTHAGRALDLGSDDDDDGPDGSGDFQLRRRDASPPPDSAPEDEGEDETGRPKKKKSKAEVMSELISKSKYHKYQRQKGKEEDDEERLGLDEELKAIRGLLVGGGAPAANGSKRKREQDVEETQPDADSESQDDGSDDDDNAGAQVDGEETSKVDRALLARLIGSPSPDPPPASPAADKDEKATESGDDDYDRFVRELAFEARAKPSDRMLTATEKAMEEAERLRGLEERRRRRMLGLQEEEDGEGVRQQGGKKGKARGEADDLEGDFVASEDEAFGVGQGLRPDGAFGGGLALDGDDDDEDDGSEGDSDEEDEEADIDLEDFEGDDLEDPDSAQGPSQPLVAPSKPSKRSKSARASTFELAYTYPCPSSHSEFLSTLASASAKPSHVPTVIERIRTLYHPSLAEDNHSKLAVLGGVVLDHIIYLSSRTDEDGAFEAINAIAEHLVALTQAYPQQLASHFVSKLSLMQRNLIRGLIDQASAPSADAVKVKVFPGLTELTVLRLVGAIWSTSDFSHPVAAPALLLVGQYLAQARVKTLSDLASGTFLCSLVLQVRSDVHPFAIARLILHNAVRIDLETTRARSGQLPRQLSAAAPARRPRAYLGLGVPAPRDPRHFLGGRLCGTCGDTGGARTVVLAQPAVDSRCQEGGAGEGRPSGRHPVARQQLCRPLRLARRLHRDLRSL